MKLLAVALWCAASTGAETASIAFCGAADIDGVLLCCGLGAGAWARAGAGGGCSPRLGGARGSGPAASRQAAPSWLLPKQDLGRPGCHKPPQAATARHRMPQPAANPSNIDDLDHFPANHGGGIFRSLSWPRILQPSGPPGPHWQASQATKCQHRVIESSVHRVLEVGGRGGSL